MDLDLFQSTERSLSLRFIQLLLKFIMIDESALYHPVSPCITLYHPVSPCIILYHPVSPCIALYRPVSPCIALYHPVSPCITLYHPLKHGLGTICTI
jgi:hypothetical protein